jgi:hypothetical protein
MKMLLAHHLIRKDERGNGESRPGLRFVAPGFPGKVK